MRRRKNILIRLLNLIVVLLSIAAPLMLICVYIAGYVSPQSTVIFSFFALGAPLIYLLNIVLLIYWIFRWRPWLTVIAIPLCLGFYGIGNFIQVDFQKEYESKRDRDEELKIVSFNTNRMGGDKAEVWHFGAVLDSLSLLDADVLCLQEFAIRDSQQLDIVDKFFDNYPYRVYQGKPEKGLWHYRGLLIASKYPLKNGTYHQFPPLENGFLCSDVIYRDDTIHLFNTHLQTTSFNALAGKKGVYGLVESDSTVAYSKKAIDNFSKNFRLRAIQADSIAYLRDSLGGNVLVVGDFNTPAMTYSYNTISDGLEDAFRQSGSGYGSTYRALNGIFRIDYVLYDRDYFQSVEYQSPEWRLSDHKPVIVSLKNIEK